MKPKTSRRDESGSRNGAAIPIVGIGASAGGIGALETLVPLLEPGAGVAYVVVQHLDPDRKSALTALLARTAKIPVIEIADQATIDTDHVFVIPPNAALTISDSRLQISAPLEQRYQRTHLARRGERRRRRRRHPVGNRQRRHAWPARHQGTGRAYGGAGRRRI
jgi:chemotaxis response regulator CheB